MSEHGDAQKKLTPWRKVFLYYPQRVQLLVMAAMNLAFILAYESGLELSTTLVGALNGFVLAGLVFFYGEHMTHSKQAVEDFFHYEASPESEHEYEEEGIDPDPEANHDPTPAPKKKSAAKKSAPKKKAPAKKSALKKKGTA